MSPDDALAAIREAEAGPQGLNAFVCLAESAPDVRLRDRSDEDGVRLAQTGLRGVAVAVKDNLTTSDLPTTCGSALLADYQSPFEATVVRRVREAGGFVIGKTNMDEFGMGSSTENSIHGPTLNPHDRTRVPGGSSGGSAAAVAAGYVSMALGSDTGGSVRQPAALCGVVGIKPTYGRVSRYGLVAFASSLDQVGTFGATVPDAARLLDVVSGYDRRDPTSVEAEPVDYGSALEAGVEGLVIGVPTEYFPDGLDPELRARMDEALAAMEAAGATQRSVSLPGTELAIPAYYVLAPAEASSNLARFDGVRYGVRAAADTVPDMYEQTRGSGFGAEVKRRIMLGTYALSAGYYDQYYGSAQRARARIRADFARVFAEGVDALFTPTTPGPAFRIGERTDDPLSMYLSDVFTVTANLAGLPATSVPVGSVSGLPVGGQILAPWWREDTMVAVAAEVERRLEVRG